MGGGSKNTPAVVIHYFCYRRSIFSMEGSFGRSNRRNDQHNYQEVPPGAPFTGWSFEVEKAHFAA